MPVGYDDLVYKIKTRLDTNEIGKTLCVDSSWYPTGIVWSWLTQGPTIYPEWDGPHCFEIVPCCQGIRGNFDNDPNDRININDLDETVDYLFRGGPTPVCLEEANIDGSMQQSPNIADLDYIVDYLFRAGPPPPACP
jgi:hypothetical protein